MDTSPLFRLDKTCGISPDEFEFWILEFGVLYCMGTRQSHRILGGSFWMVAVGFLLFSVNSVTLKQQFLESDLVCLVSQFELKSVFENVLAYVCSIVISCGTIRELNEIV